MQSVSLVARAISSMERVAEMRAISSPILISISNSLISRSPVVEEDGCIMGIMAQADVATRLEEPEATAEMVEEISRGTRT